MQTTNKLIKKKLIELGFANFYTFPHSRFLKDYHFAGCEFDAIGWKKKGDKRIYLFQFKTNKICSKNQLKLYKEIEKKYYCRCVWISRFNKTKNKCPNKYKGKIVMFNYPKTKIASANCEI